MARVTNHNEGGVVGIQSGDQDDNGGETVEQGSTVVNHNEGGTVGIQAGTVSGNTVIVNGR